MKHIVRLGAIDIGSNSVRLLITDVLEYEQKIIFKKDSLIRVPLKLGEDTFQKGIIDEVKKEKLILLLQSFQNLMNVNDVQFYKICATSAFREAKNSTEALEEIYAKTNMIVDVIDTKEECRYILLNKNYINYDDTKLYVFVDVGGGCTELVLYSENSESISKSFNLGTIRTLSKQEAETEWAALKEWLHENLNDGRKICLIGSGGNVNKISSLLRRCGRIRREELVSFRRKLKDMSYEERLVKYNINLNRADVIIPAVDIYLRIMKMAKMPFIDTPIIGLADGIIKDMYNPWCINK